MKSTRLASSTFVASLAAATVGVVACTGPAGSAGAAGPALTPSPRPQTSTARTYPMEASGRYYIPGTMPDTVNAQPTTGQLFGGRQQLEPLPPACSPTGG